MHGWRVLSPSLLLIGLAPACSADESDCSCSVETAAERRALSCGASVCIDGVLLACVNQAEIVERGACTTPAASDQGDDAEPSAPGDTPATTDTGCDDLQSYCSTSCRSPAATAADCQATAARQDGDACRQWSLASGVLCRP
jgi:hypothetical protein